MQKTRNRKPKALAIVLAYVVALHGILASSVALQAATERTGIVAQLCRTLAGASDVPAGDHNDDECAIICASGACSQTAPLHPVGAVEQFDPARSATSLPGAGQVAGVIRPLLTASARGPPLSSL